MISQMNIRMMTRSRMIIAANLIWKQKGKEGRKDDDEEGCLHLIGLLLLLVLWRDSSSP